jgi:hypothetical protein
MAANATTNHDEIRKWAESKGGKPAAVDRTHKGGDVGIVRIMFPDNPQSEHSHLVEISWDEFFEQFEEAQLALLYEENSLFSKIVGRDTVDRREHGDHAHDSRRKAQDDKPHEGGRRGASKGEQREHQVASRSADTESDDDLKSREYRDEQGNIHHHTRAYMERQEGKK